MSNEPVLVAKNDDGTVSAMCRIDGEPIKDIIETLCEWDHRPRTLHIMTRKQAIAAFDPAS